MPTYLFTHHFPEGFQGSAETAAAATAWFAGLGPSCWAAATRQARATARGTAGATAIGAASGAIENFTRNLAYDVSPQGVRVVCVRASAMPDTRTIQETRDMAAADLKIAPDQVFALLANSTLLKVSPTIADTARAAAFVASAHARMLTGTVLNASAGAVHD